MSAVAKAMQHRQQAFFGHYDEAARLTSLIDVTAALGISSLPSGPLAQQIAAVTRFLDPGTEGVLQ